LKARLWRLVHGPEWEESLREAAAGRDRFSDNLEALLDGIGLSPFQYARPIQPEAPDERYGTTRDEANGYRLVVFIHVDRRTRTCTLGWVATEDL
jgi:hypothetical protein